MSLHQRLRAGIEASQWVIDEVLLLEAKNNSLQQDIAILLDCMRTTRWRMQRYKMTTVELDALLNLHGVDYQADKPKVTPQMVKKKQFR